MIFNAVGGIVRRLSLEGGTRGFRLACAVLALLMLLLSAYDLCSPKFSAPTVLRQSQTAMLTENFTAAGFTLGGLTLDLFGHERKILALEFPLYNLVTGLAVAVFGHGIFWGKLVSLICSLIGLVLLCGLLRELYDEQTALRGGLFFVLSPVGVLMRTTYQPDSMALMFVLAALLALWHWRARPSPLGFAVFCALLLLSGLAKYPLMIPFLPVMALALLTHAGRFRRPDFVEVIIGIGLFVIPFVAWYLYRGTITAPEFNAVTERATFLLGDLSRFVSPVFYINPAYTITFLSCSLVGLLFVLFGLSRLTWPEAFLLAGVPFYYVLVPTVKDQHYYIYACAPIFALFMAKGSLAFAAYCRERHLAVLNALAGLAFVAVFVFVTVYAVFLRRDETIYGAAQSVANFTAMDELVVSVMLHNRTVVYGGHDPTFFYYARRKGWNVHVTADEAKRQQVVAKVREQVAQYRQQGAKWLVVSWYSPAAESPVERLIPASARTSKDPGIGGRLVFEALSKEHRLVVHHDDFAVLAL